MQQIILASQSQRRKELLAQMGVKFKIIPSNFEEQLDHARDAEEVALELAFGKARDVARKHPEALVIGSDTIVAIAGHQLGKPTDKADARSMLEKLAGHINVVTTAVVLICKAENTEETVVVSSKVYFKPLERAKLEKYVASGDWHDKAGGYGVQSGAAPLIERIEGEYDAVLGLPTRQLAALLQKHGVLCHPVTLKPTVPVLLP